MYFTLQRHEIAGQTSSSALTKQLVSEKDEFLIQRSCTLLYKVTLCCTFLATDFLVYIYIYIYIYINIYIYIGIDLVVRVFTNGPGDLGSIPGRVIPKTQNIVLDASLLNTQHYKVRIKGKVEQSRERSSTFPYTLV